MSNSVADDLESVRFLGLEPTEDRLLWKLPVSLGICGASGYLHGGCAIGAATTVLEIVTGRRMAWINAQYISRVQPGDEVDLCVDLRAEGNAMAQAAVTATFEGRLVFAATAGLGGRDIGVDASWATMPEVAEPEDCPRRRNDSRVDGSFTTVADIRVARAELGNSNTVYWGRLPGTLATTPTGIAMLADLLPSGLRIALSSDMRGSSLDNTVRTAGTDPTEWLLIDIHVTGVGSGIGHGQVRAFSQNGVLVGSASQSFAITTVHGDLGTPLR